MTAITYRINEPVSAQAVADAFRSSGLNRPVDDMDRIARMLQHANLTITAWDGDKLVGLARALTDFSYCCYLSDLAVSGPYQKQGIGKVLIEKVQQEIGEESMLLLLSVPDAMAYYPKVGFEEVKNGWIIKRRR